MDKHLESCHMGYERDPMATLLRMLPASAPPLGVRHRVATKAKTLLWAHRQYRATTPTEYETILRSAAS